jgi:hypothetical protein
LRGVDQSIQLAEIVACLFDLAEPERQFDTARTVSDVQCGTDTEVSMVVVSAGIIFYQCLQDGSAGLVIQETAVVIQSLAQFTLRARSFRWASS